jgi:hypothetical protein
LLKKRAFHLLIALLPPFLFSILIPDLFMAALSFAGGIVVVFLYGILPPLLVYKTKGERQWIEKTPFLLAIGAFALFVLCVTLFNTFA